MDGDASRRDLDRTDDLEQGVDELRSERDRAHEVGVARLDLEHPTRLGGVVREVRPAGVRDLPREVVEQVVHQRLWRLHVRGLIAPVHHWMPGT